MEHGDLSIGLNTKGYNCMANSITQAAEPEAVASRSGMEISIIDLDDQQSYLFPAFVDVSTADDRF